ncbi:HupE/UreJ family protein [Ideonella sp.]|uniref:HupE/UreJ family protein n=1 Tax=Ideonella sp. TaxID=1929293 RepID=UPI002B4AA6AF|nr:HupE/UreJ family protein [Ideonella sp.]HJV68875.1 HupE/UreJ family protein [Ideonella sp.]
MRSGRLTLTAVAALAGLWLAPEPARAHAPSNATLNLSAEGPVVQQRWDIALRDLDRVLPLDADDDGQITWGELRGAWPQIETLVDATLRLAAADGSACTPGALAAPRIDTHADGTYAVLERRWQCAADAGAGGLRVDYRLFADSDASHRGLLQWRAGARAAATTAVLAPGAGPVLMAGAGAAAPAATPAAGFAGFVAEGVHHILIGTDHVLFLLALMLPAVVGPAADAAARRWTEALVQVAKVVTAFTVAHSITLALATLGYADPPTRLVESLIAASVVLAAIDNLKRFLPGVRWPPGAPGAGVPAPPAKRVSCRFGAAERWLPGAPGAGVPAPPAKRVSCRFGAAERWQLAFTFGLVHGFGFAGALKELGLDPAALARSLVGFNLGVELGQLGIVALALPLAWWARETRFYRRVVLGGGSAAIALVAALWFTERAFDVALITT